MDYRLTGRDDRITGTDGDDFIDGYRYTDVKLRYSGGLDRIDTGAGDDRIFIYTDRALVSAGSGDDSATVWLKHGTHNTIKGEDGNDTLTVRGFGGAKAKVYGGAGADTFIYYDAKGYTGSIHYDGGASSTGGDRLVIANNALKTSVQVAHLTVTSVEILEIHDDITIRGDLLDKFRFVDSDAGGRDIHIVDTGKAKVTFRYDAVVDSRAADTDLDLKGSTGNLKVTVGSYMVGRETIHVDGDARILGGSGNDSFLAFATGNDRFYGYAGNDTLAGGAGDDLLDGGDGDDALTAGDGTDTLFGGAGNDQLVGGRGVDTLDGGAGDDELIKLAGAATFIGGDGNDTVIYSDGLRIRVDLADPSQNLGAAQHDSFSSIENVTGSNVDDELLGDDGANRLVGGTVTGRGGDDELTGHHVYGGSGDDVLHVTFWPYLLSDGGPADLVADGGDGSDTLDLSNLHSSITAYVDLATMPELISVENVRGTDVVDIQFNTGDRIRGNEIANVFWGGGSDDVLDGRGGDDSLYGEIGNDTLTGGAGADLLDGGDGNDTADFSTATSAVHADLGEVAGNDLGDGLGDRFVSVENLSGSTAADILRGDAAGNLLAGSSGDDTLVGRGGDDTLIGGVGADSLDGGSGYDTVEYTTTPADGTPLVIDMRNPGAGTGEAAGDSFVGIERVIGSQAADLMSGSEIGETLLGNGGSDTLRGQGGDDTLIAGPRFPGIRAEGTVTFEGGSGADHFVMHFTTMDYVITDFENGQDKFDVAGLGASFDGAFIKAIDADGDGAIDDLTIDLGSIDFTVLNTAATAIDKADFIF